MGEQEERGVTRTAIAQRLNCNPSVITKLMKDDRRGVSGAVATAIERATTGWKRGPILAADWYTAKDAA